MYVYAYTYIFVAFVYIFVHTYASKYRCVCVYISLYLRTWEAYSAPLCHILVLSSSIVPVVIPFFLRLQLFRTIAITPPTWIWIVSSRLQSKLPRSLARYTKHSLPFLLSPLSVLFPFSFNAVNALLLYALWFLVKSNCR